MKTNGPNKQLERVVLQLAKGMVTLTKTTQGLAQAQLHTHRAVQRTQRAVAQLASVTEERFKETDERLNALIKIVDDLVRREGRQ